jgi:hypothetical protein
MRREFSVRVSESLAKWVRRRGSATAVVKALADRAQRGRLGSRFLDPGPGPVRLTVRLPSETLQTIRQVTRSRRSLVALRKLIHAGYQARFGGQESQAPAPQVHSNVRNTQLRNKELDLLGFESEAFPRFPGAAHTVLPGIPSPGAQRTRERLLRDVLMAFAMVFFLIGIRALLTDKTEF